MPSYIFPEPLEISTIAQDFTEAMTADDPAFTLFPQEPTNDQTIAWEQEDNYRGLQQLRGIDGAPNRVANVGMKSYAYAPPAFGEHIDFKEREILNQRKYGTLGDAINLEGLAVRKARQLVQRRIRRMRHMVWTLLSTGTFQARLPTGGVGFTDSYTLLTAAFSAFSNPATGTPLADYRALIPLAKGHSVSFGSKARAFTNPNTAIKMMANANAADLGGKRVSGGNSINSIKDINAIYMDNGLPTVEVIDASYIDDNGTAQWFIPDNITIIVGYRDDGEDIGNFVMCPNLNNPDLAAAPYHKITNEGDRVPPVIAEHDGFTGGLTIKFPGAVIVATNT